MKQIVCQDGKKFNQSEVDAIIRSVLLRFSESSVYSDKATFKDFCSYLDGALSFHGYGLE